MNQLPHFRKLREVGKRALFVLLLAVIGCDSLKEVDFQQERCKEKPTGTIRSANKGNLRFEFELADTGKSVETEPFRIVWTIDGVSFAAQRVSYQFASKGVQKVSVVLTNRCFMQTEVEENITVN